MNALPRCFLCALTVQTLLFGVCAAWPNLGDRLSLNVWKLPERERQMQEAQREIDEADVRLNAVCARLGNRERITDEVIAGQIGLLDAAARFRELNTTALPTPLDLRGCYAGDSDEERCCRQVIAWVTTRLEQKSTAEAEMVAERLEEELREYLRRDGTVCLSQ
jgi:hypothetical protein